MATWQDVERLHKGKPDWTARQIANALGCHDSYVRATARRRGWSLPRQYKVYRQPRTARIVELEAALRAMVDVFGAGHVDSYHGAEGETLARARKALGAQP